MSGVTGMDDGATHLAGVRRLDWRFLLADPALGDVVVTGRPDAELMSALETHAAHVAVESPGRLTPAELVLAHRPTGPELIAAIDRVAPDGWIVVELAGRRGLRRAATLTTGAVDAVEARLRREGFVDLAGYWTWPDHSTCLEIVPLDQPAVLRTSLDRRRSGRRARLKARAVAAAFRVGLGPAVLPAITLVGRRSSVSMVASATPTAPLIDAFVAANRVRLGLEGLGVGLPASLLVTPRFQASAHVVGLVVPAGAEGPAVVVKLERLAGPSRTLAREAACLRVLAELETGTPPGIPRLLSEESIGGHAGIVETALVGSPLDPAAIARDRAGIVDAVGRWVRTLRRADDPGLADDRWARLIDLATATLAEALADDPVDLRTLELARRLMEPLRTTRLPLVVEHGDLGHPNLLRLATGPAPRIGAIDWELGESAGLPLTDFLFFLGYVAVASMGRRGGRRSTPADEQAGRIVEAFAGTDPWAAVAARHQAEAEGIDGALVTPLLVATWTRALAGLATRLDVGAPPDQGPTAVPLDPVTAGRRLRGHRYHPIWRHLVTSAERLDRVGHG